MTMEVRIIRVEGCESRFGYDRSWTQGLRDLLVCTYYTFAMVLSLPSYCLCHRAVLLHLPCSLVLSCCLLYLRYRAVFAIVPSLLCYGIVVAACCLSYCVFAIVFYRAVFLIVLFLVSHCLCYVLCSLWYRACCPRYRAVFVIGLNDIFSSVRCCLRSRCFFVIVLSLSSPCLRHRPVLGCVVRAWSFCVPKMVK